MMKRTLIILAAMSLTGLTSCGGSGAQPLTGQAVGVVLGALNTVLGNLPRSNSAPALPITGATTAALRGPVAAATDCETVAPATPVDADGDGIALSKVGTFNCTNTTVGTSRWTRQGSYEVSDLNDAVAGIAGGVRVEYNITNYNYEDLTTGSTYASSFNGFWNHLLNGSVWESTADVSGHSGSTSTTYRFVTDYDFRYTWDWSQTPDNSGAPFTTGSQRFQGTYRLSGMFVHESAGGNHSQGQGTFELEYYSRNLRYDSACAKWYTSGSIFVEDVTGNSFEIRYACSSASLYVNGRASDLWTP